MCVGWIDLANYEDIVKAVEYLNDIEEKRSSKFPAVFYGLGSAYYKLNRYVFSFTPVRGFGYMCVEMSGWSLIHTIISGELECIFGESKF